MADAPPAGRVEAARRLLATLQDSRAALLEVAAEHLEPSRARKLARHAERVELRVPVLVELRRRREALPSTPLSPPPPSEALPRRGSSWVPTHMPPPEASPAPEPPAPPQAPPRPEAPLALSGEAPVVRAALALRLLEEGLDRAAVLGIVGLAEGELASLSGPARALGALASRPAPEAPEAPPSQVAAPAPLPAPPPPAVAPEAAPRPVPREPPPVRRANPAPMVAPPLVSGVPALPLQAAGSPRSGPDRLAAWGLSEEEVVPAAPRPGPPLPAEARVQDEIPEVRFPTLETPMQVRPSSRGGFVTEVRFADLPPPPRPAAPEASPPAPEPLAASRERVPAEESAPAPGPSLPAFVPELRLPELPSREPRAPSAIPRPVAPRLAGADNAWAFDDDPVTQPRAVLPEPLTPPRAPPLDAQARAAEAEAALESGRFSEAVAAWSDCLDLDPQDVSARLGRGRCLLELGDYPGAASDFDIAEDAAPGQLEPVLAQADLRFFRKDYGEAVPAYDRVLQRDPSRALARCRRGLAHFHLHNWSAAVADLEEAQATDPSIPQVGTFLRLARQGMPGRS